MSWTARRDQPPHNEFHLDDTALRGVALARHLQRFVNRPVDRLRQYSEANLVPDPFDEPELAIGGERNPLDRRSLPMALGSQPCLLFGKPVGPAKEARPRVDIETLPPEIARPPARPLTRRGLTATKS